MSENEIERVANVMLDENLTIRSAAQKFNIPKSTLHYNVTKKLKSFNFNLYINLHDFLQKNFSEKHIRGGKSTQEKYKKLYHKK